jgi:hypothetical protein
MIPGKKGVIKITGILLKIGKIEKNLPRNQ